MMSFHLLFIPLILGTPRQEPPERNGLSIFPRHTEFYLLPL